MRALATLLVALLLGCGGGGDPEDQQEHDVKLPPSDLCQQDPRPVQCL